MKFFLLLIKNRNKKSKFSLYKKSIRPNAKTRFKMKECEEFPKNVQICVCHSRVLGTLHLSHLPPLCNIFLELEWILHLVSPIGYLQSPFFFLLVKLFLSSPFASDELWIFYFFVFNAQSELVFFYIFRWFDFIPKGLK